MLPAFLDLWCCRLSHHFTLLPLLLIVSPGAASSLALLEAMPSTSWFCRLPSLTAGHESASSVQSLGYRSSPCLPVSSHCLGISSEAMRRLWGWTDGFESQPQNFVGHVTLNMFPNHSSLMELLKQWNAIMNRNESICLVPFKCTTNISYYTSYVVSIFRNSKIYFEICSKLRMKIREMSMIGWNILFEYIGSSVLFQINLQSNLRSSHILAISPGKKNALLRTLTEEVI